MRLQTLILALVCCAANFAAEAQTDSDSTIVLQEVNIVNRQTGMKKLRGRATNTEIITSAELTRAACCNLGESFTTNPSVDVSYNDAATGARQIKLLGLSGSYVQMLTENIPNFRGSALPYGLGYVPGTWLQSIQVSKGASSVKNGYESVTGQINIEMKKPQADQEFAANAYVDTEAKTEINANANIHLSPRLSTGLLVHGENTFASHDNNGDGFLDMPKLRQVAAMNRWAWMGRNYVFQAGVKFLSEHRQGGQDEKHLVSGPDHPGGELYKIDIRTNRWEAFTKNAYIFDYDNDGNVALILSGSHNNFRSGYGYKTYRVNQINIYASLMFERKWAENHALSTGLSLNYDNYSQHMRLVQDLSTAMQMSKEIESVGGAYLQYTYNIGSRLLLMGGMRYDYSSIWGAMLTPRLHARWTPGDYLTLHGSAGRGLRTPHVLAENNFLLASGRQIIIQSDIGLEKAWNFGLGAGSTIYIHNKPLNLSADYYYTDFQNQLVVDLDSDPHAVGFRNLSGRSYSHTLQLEASYPFFKDFTFSAAYRLTDVKTDYGQGRMEKPLTSRNKGLFTIQYAPMMGLWQFDVTCSVNGGGRMPTPYKMPDGSMSWSQTYHPYAQLNAQLTRNFRHWSVYLGGENLTAYRQKKPIVGAENPWGSGFDATMVYAPLHGAIIYVGFRYNFTRY